MSARHGMKELVAAADAQARLLGAPPPKERVVADWIDEGLITPATPTGRQRGVSPSWVYRDDALETVKKIVTFKAKGCTRYSALRICLAMHGHQIPFAYLPDDLANELVRFRNHLDRRHPSSFDIRDGNEPSALETRRALRQLGPSFATVGLALPGELYAKLNSVAKFGGSPALIVPEHSGEPIQFLERLLGVMIADKAPLMNFGGALGRSEEIPQSGEKILRHITREDFETSAMNYWSLVCDVSLQETFLLVQGLGFLEPLREVVETTRTSLSAPEWLVNMAAMGAIDAFHVRNSAQQDSRSA